MTKQTKKQLIKIHLELHQKLDQLAACYIQTTKKTLTKTSLMDFIKWSYKQTINPSCYKKSKS